jgi:soluble lytic murein transglycosylase-like protein
LPNGPGAAPDDFKQFTTLVSQHAKDYQTPQALLAAMSASPTYASLSAAQANQLVTMWQKTRQAHGEPVAAAPPAPVQPPATPPAQPANGNPMAGARTTSWAGGQAGGAVAHGTGGSYLGGAAPAPPAQPKPAAPSGPPPIANVIAAAASAETRGAAIQAVAKTVNVDSALLEALMTQESSGSNKAVSKDGALGFGQLMPGTASDLGVDPRDPVQNMAGSAVYLRQMLDRFKTIPRALAAYNQGPDAVVQARNGIPQAAVPYVQSVMARYLARRRQEERVEAMGGQQRGNI